LLPVNPIKKCFDLYVVHVPERMAFDEKGPCNQKHAAAYTKQLLFEVKLTPRYTLYIYA
jgi:hypothetical protein